jgi:hypothetical protein
VKGRPGRSVNGTNVPSDLLSNANLDAFLLQKLRDFGKLVIHHTAEKD